MTKTFGLRYPLVISAMGIVFGDIGTSPLYTFDAALAVVGAPDVAKTLGLLSLIFWSLVLVVTLKYVLLILRADHHGNGGILALTELIRRPNGTIPKAVWIIAISGGCLLFGDAVITPAISVLSAVEGISQIAPSWGRHAPLVASTVLGILFAAQYFGAMRLSHLFGPIMAFWFATLAVSGGVAIWHEPSIMAAANPAHAISLLLSNPTQALLILGAVFLCVTGGEALYADLGEFGRGPIQRGWLLFVGPALLLNYAGQATMLVATDPVPTSTFFALFPPASLPAIVILATVATVIASQAIITGLFGLASQAIDENLLPALRVRHLDSKNIHDVMVPAVNTLLAIGSIGLVLSFQTSAALAAAYGLAVAGAMITTSLLFGVFLWTKAQGLTFVLIPVFCIDAAFFAATLGKFATGGWVPVLFATLAAGTILYHRVRTRRPQ